MRDTNIDDAGFEQTITLRDAYRSMERFVNDYRARGDTSVSDFSARVSLCGSRWADNRSGSGRRLSESSGRHFG
jgi:hypothetical protein